VKAAHFLLIPELAASPPNNAIISAWLELGIEVDLYAPGAKSEESGYGSRVKIHSVEYGRRWLSRNILLPRWRNYVCFSGTSEDPLAVSGSLSCVWRKPSFALADEIKSGSYRGNSPASWKRLCKWAMRRCGFQIVNDAARIGLQREYSEASASQPIFVYPGCYRSPPPPADRSATRNYWGCSDSDLVIGYSGGFNLTAGADWLLAAVHQIPCLKAVIQPLGVDPFVRYLLNKVEGHQRIFVEGARLSWAESWSQASCIDIGVCVYLNQAPQFQNMGISSNRLCMFLAMGVPVIASRQPSFQFVEDYDCGILVDNEVEFVAAVDIIRNRLETMKDNALRCAREYIDAPGKYLVLRDAIAKLVGRDPGEPLT